MQWSSLKKKVESFFVPSLKGRVELRSTRYRGTHDQTGRGYITVDGKEVWSMCSLNFWKTEYPTIARISEKEQILPTVAQIIVDAQLEQEGILSQWDFYRALENYCNSSIEASLESVNPLTKSLAILDSRVGKRRLKNINFASEHSMIQYFFALRCRVEGISPTNSSSGRRTDTAELQR